MDSRLLEILACPICKGPLKYQRDTLTRWGDQTEIFQFSIGNAF